MARTLPQRIANKDMLYKFCSGSSDRGEQSKADKWMDECSDRKRGVANVDW